MTKEELLAEIQSLMAPEDDLMTNKEVMEYLKIKRTQYKKLKDMGLIPVRGLGTLERVFKSELHANFEKIQKYLDVA